MKALKVTISGTYQNSKRETVDFEDLTGFVPYTDEDIAKMHIRGRYARIWIKEAKNKDGEKIYKDGVHRVRTVYIDDIEEAGKDFSFIGKDIKKMSFEELQDLAVLKDLRLIPRKKEDMRLARIRAYVDYSEKILKKTIDYKAEGFEDDFMKLPAIIVDDTNPRIESSTKITNDEIIENEMKSYSTKDDPRTRFTLSELKQLANEKNISYHPNIGFDKLYKKLYE